MDLTNVPFNVPVIVQSIRKGSNLQNPIGSSIARCLVDNRDFYEQLILRKVKGDKIAIESVYNARVLQVRPSGECVFVSGKPREWEVFTMEIDSAGSLYFVSCHTGKVLQCDDNDDAKCANHNRQRWEAWRIVEPRHGTTANQDLPTTSEQMDHALVGKDRQNFILELIKYGRSADEIEQIVSRLLIHQQRSLRARHRCSPVSAATEQPCISGDELARCH